MNLLSSLSVVQLKQALTLKERIEALQGQLSALVDGSAAVPAKSASALTVAPAAKRKPMSAAARARISAAAKARWAKQKSSVQVSASAPQLKATSKPAGKVKRTISAEGRAKLAAFARARWAKIRAAGKSKL